MSNNYTFPGGQAASNDVGGVHHPLVKLEYGADGSATLVTPTSPMPVREPTFAAQIASGNKLANTTSQTLVSPSTGATRALIEVWNTSSTDGVWLRLATTAATIGLGPFLPPYGYWAAPYTGGITCYAGATSMIAYVER